jgi:hypothetical protein
MHTNVRELEAEEKNSNRSPEILGAAVKPKIRIQDPQITQCARAATTRKTKTSRRGRNGRREEQTIDLSLIGVFSLTGKKTTIRKDHKGHEDRNKNQIHTFSLCGLCVLSVL